jgi:hypothetical protein
MTSSCVVVCAVVCTTVVVVEADEKESLWSSDGFCFVGTLEKQVFVITAVQGTQGFRNTRNGWFLPCWCIISQVHTCFLGTGRRSRNPLLLVLVVYADDVFCCCQLILLQSEVFVIIIIIVVQNAAS